MLNERVGSQPLLGVWLSELCTSQPPLRLRRPGCPQRVRRHGFMTAIVVANERAMSDAAGGKNMSFGIVPGSAAIVDMLGRRAKTIARHSTTLSASLTSTQR